MSTARVLCIGAGGAGGGGGGGGAGGFRDETGIELQDFAKYEVSIGRGVANNNGENTFFKKADLDLLTVSSSFNAGYDENISHDVDVSTLLPNVGEIWAKITISGTREDRVDGVYVTLEGSDLDILYDGIYHFDVTSILSGKTEVTFTGRGDDNTATIAIVFEANHLIHSIGGGRGGSDRFDNDGDGERGKFGASGGGGGAAQSNESGGNGGSRVPGQGNVGSSGSRSKGTNPRHDSAMGGGGGAGGAAIRDGGYNGQPGGIGAYSDISGVNTPYAGGGGGYYGGGEDGANGAGQANFGGGGFGNNETGKDGGVVIRYTRADVTHTYVGGTITDVGGDRIHTFTSDGVLAPLLPSVGALML